MDEHHLLTDLAKVSVLCDFHNHLNQGFFTMSGTDLVSDNASSGLELLDNLFGLTESENGNRWSVFSNQTGKSAGLGVNDN